MKNKIRLFEESPMIGGYSLAVRDDWVYKIKRVHISEKEKELYIEKFGEKIISYSKFFDWWCQINNCGIYSEDEYDDKF